MASFTRYDISIAESATRNLEKQQLKKLTRQFLPVKKEKNKSFLNFQVSPLFLEKKYF